MASNEAENSLELTLSEIFSGLLESYRMMHIPLQRYLFFILAPSVAFFILSAIIALVLDLPLMIRAPIPLLGFLVISLARDKAMMGEYTNPLVVDILAALGYLTIIGIIVNYLNSVLGYFGMGLF